MSAGPEARSQPGRTCARRRRGEVSACGGPAGRAGRLCGAIGGAREPGAAGAVPGAGAAGVLQPPALDRAAIFRAPLRGSAIALCCLCLSYPGTCAMSVAMIGAGSVPIRISSLLERSQTLA